MIDQNAEALSAPAASYLAHAASLLARLADEQHESLTTAGRAVARTLMRLPRCAASRSHSSCGPKGELSPSSSTRLRHSV